MVKTFSLGAALAALFVSAHALADDAPALHHAPPATADLGEPLVIGARIDHPELVKSAYVVFKSGANVGQVPFLRSASSFRPYVATVPAEYVRAPGLAYTVEIEQPDGTRVPAFASREHMHDVDVLTQPSDDREQAQLRRLGGRRSVLRTSGEYVTFGSTDATLVQPGSNATTVESVRDDFYRVEGEYTYRFLQTVAEFGLRAGVVRGHSVVPGETDKSKLDVGLNYGSPRLRFRCNDWLHLEVAGLTSVTEVGFSVGGAGAALIGDAYGTHLTVGFESIEVFGTRGYSRFDITATKRLGIAPIIEVTTMPHASQAGVRLLGDVTADLGAGFSAGVRGGYQARTFARGGPTLGGTLAYAF